MIKPDMRRVHAARLKQVEEKQKPFKILSKLFLQKKLLEEEEEEIHSKNSRSELPVQTVSCNDALTFDNTFLMH